jgi:beta-glucosidase
MNRTQANMPDLSQLLSQMTLEEKAALCTGAGPWTTTPVSRLGVPKIVVADGPHGVRHPKDVEGMLSESYPATCFPTASALAATWDVDLMQAMGQALAQECLALGVDVLLGPGVNMKRSPLGGRNFEYFSEDPYLAGEMAAALISGVQSRGVGTALKHFAANNQEYQRFRISADVDERTLREIYLPAFELAVKQAQPWMIMCAYNKLNGVFCSQHQALLTGLLKEEWGFEGVVVSDWGAVRDRVAALEAGLDLEMPGPKPCRVQAVVEAVRSSELPEAMLDEAVRRILRLVLKSQETPKGSPVDWDGHHELARQVAAEGMVLLKNNGLLPLTGHKRIAVIGRAAAEAHIQGGGSSHLNPTRVAVPFEELRAQAGAAELTYAEGYPADESPQPALLEEAVAVARAADVAILYLALPAYKESEGYDRTDLHLTRQQLALIQAVTDVQPQTVVVLNNGAPVAMAWIDQAAAVLEAWLMGQGGAAAVADVLFGKVNPSGKLAETFPRALEDTPAYLHWPGEMGRVRYAEGLHIGYRYYDARRVPVQFPFGYGLSYTTFAYSHPMVYTEQDRTEPVRAIKDTDSVWVAVDVTNTGKMAGKETVQVYVHDPMASLVRPPKELKGFAKVDLQPGETKTVHIPLNYRPFDFYHPAYRQWITESGEFELLIGASAADIRCHLTISLNSTVRLPCLLDAESTFAEWLDDPRGKDVLGPMVPLLVKQFGQALGSADGVTSGIGLEVLPMMREMPLVNVLEFQEDRLDRPPEAIVADLLAAVYRVEAEPIG